MTDITTKQVGTFLAEIKSTSAITKAPTGSFEAILSVPTVDRDKEVVDAGCFDPLPEHITIDVDHAMTVEKTVASGRPFYDGPVLKFEGTYASHPLAQMVRSLVDEKHIRTMSVAYMGAFYEVDENDGLMHLRKAELLNAGIVGIPSNRDALITASKSLAAAATRIGQPAADDTAGTKNADDLAELVKNGLELVASLTAALEAAGKNLAPASADAEPTETTPERDAAAKAAASVPAAVDVAALTARARTQAAVTTTALL